MKDLRLQGRRSGGAVDIDTGGAVRQRAVQHLAEIREAGAQIQLAVVLDAAVLQAVHCRRGGRIFGKLSQHQQFLRLVAVQICHVEHGIGGGEQLFHLAVAVAVNRQRLVRLVYAAVAHEDLVLGLVAHGGDHDAFHFRAVRRTVAD